VKCSGGSVCLRCNKHDFTCRYSLASRAGKPKGSKNKATLKKLETFQEKSHQVRYYSDSGIPTLLEQSQTMNVSGSYWQASIPGSNMEHRQPQVSDFERDDPCQLTSRYSQPLPTCHQSTWRGPNVVAVPTVVVLQ
jgi:hypothetical protein